VAAQVGEPDVAEGAGQLERDLLALVGVAGPERVKSTMGLGSMNWLSI
jgi:hypothetical protein